MQTPEAKRLNTIINNMVIFTFLTKQVKTNIPFMIYYSKLFPGEIYIRAHV